MRGRMRGPKVGEPRGIETRVPPRFPEPRQASLLTSTQGGQSIPSRHPCQSSRCYREKHLPGGHSLLAKSAPCRAAPCHPEAGQARWLFDRWDHVPRPVGRCEESAGSLTHLYSPHDSGFSAQFNFRCGLTCENQTSWLSQHQQHAFVWRAPTLSTAMANLSSSKA